MRMLAPLLLCVLLAGCKEGDADDVGIASECDTTEDCPTFETDTGETQLTCLTQFTAGYCGVEGCTSTEDCPETSICVAHDDGSNYCFRACEDKEECNANRSPDSEANCSANFDWADPADDDGSKACIPPSSGT